MRKRTPRDQKVGQSLENRRILDATEYAACGYCKARSGEPCQTKDWRPTSIHKGRRKKNQPILYTMWREGQLAWYRTDNRPCKIKKIRNKYERHGTVIDITVDCEKYTIPATCTPGELEPIGTRETKLQGFR